MQRVLFVLSLVGQLGFLIALPAAALGFGGAWLDRSLETSPLFILLGLSLAIASSSLFVGKLIQRINRV
ncbi:AtpZ/AtpI family protein [Candidatus Berkelbacteria bacterium]|nr:AtpZ/AtpI family protein [Candidatus Berkelbacteria bacterium]